MTTRLAITGASGQLGRALLRSLPDGWVSPPASHSRIDVRDWTAVRDWIATVRPDYVVHAAAMTNVDGCESAENEAFSINALGTRHVASAAERVGATLIYVSTNFVFDGEKETAYHEFDTVHPKSVYGASKLAGEREAVENCNRTYIVRTAMVYDESGSNFVNTMLRLMSERTEVSVVDDQSGNPTYALDLARGLFRLIQVAPSGLYHLTNTGETSWHGWATEIKRIKRLACEIHPIDGASFERAAAIPTNGSLTSLGWPEASTVMPHWTDGLRRCLN